MTMLRFYQAMPPISPLILRGLSSRCILIHQEPWLLLPRLRMFLLGESARKDQNQLVVRRRARRSRWNITSPGPGSPAGHFPAAASASMPPTIGNDDDVTKIILPSNATDKSTDTEEVKRQLYLENSSGAVFTPPEIDVLVGGSAKKNQNQIVVRIRDARRQQPRTTIVLVVQGLLILHWAMGKNKENA